MRDREQDDDPDPLSLNRLTQPRRLCEVFGGSEVRVRVRHFLTHAIGIQLGLRLRLVEDLHCVHGGQRIRSRGSNRRQLHSEQRSLPPVNAKTPTIKLGLTLEVSL